jgi:hypothetical protein
MADFTWTQHPRAEALVNELLSAATNQSAAVLELEDRLRRETSTTLFNWLDHIGGPVPTERLSELGFVEGWQAKPGVWRHPGAQLPAIIAGDERIVALRVDDVVSFAQTHAPEADIEGSALSGFRRVSMRHDGVLLAAVERRSWECGVVPQTFDDRESSAAVQAWRLWQERSRPDVAGPVAVLALESSTAIAARMVELVGTDLAASYVLEIERQYWQRRNMAAAVQHARQNRLGLGWGNNDHHTFRSSRSGFRPLVQLFNVLGFENRERFYAGEQAGWGAQVLEHPGCGGVLFTDVDLGPGEVGMDFSAVELPEAEHYGTVGMWCALHGESILHAGMHHLEGQFEFDQLREDLHVLGIGHMKPFSDFAHLRQAFTAAEKWPVSQKRLDHLVAAGHLSAEKASEFATAGVAGSHLENLQRREGFKGFNQHSVSDTMRVTDPRAL